MKHFCTRRTSMTDRDAGSVSKYQWKHKSRLLSLSLCVGSPCFGRPLQQSVHSLPARWQRKPLLVTSLRFFHTDSKPQHQGNIFILQIWGPPPHTHTHRPLSLLALFLSHVISPPPAVTSIYFQSGTVFPRLSDQHFCAKGIGKVSTYGGVAAEPNVQSVVFAFKVQF